MRQHVDSWRAQQLSDCGILSSFSLLTIVALSGQHYSPLKAITWRR